MANETKKDEDEIAHSGGAGEGDSSATTQDRRPSEGASPEEAPVTAPANTRSEREHEH